MCECGCEDGFQSVKIMVPSAKEGKPDSQEALVSEKTEESED